MQAGGGRRGSFPTAEPVPEPPKSAYLGGTRASPPEAAADAGDPALGEVSALLAASETRTTKFLAVRFAELGEMLSALAKAVESSGEHAAAPERPKNDGEAATELEKRIRTFAADFDRCGNCNGTTTDGGS